MRLGLRCSGHAVALMVLLVAVLPSELYAQTLNPGDIAIIGMNSDAPDEFAFVALAVLPPGTKIIFADHGWQASGSLRTKEQYYMYTAPNTIARGTVIRIDASAGSPRFSTDGDQLLAFQYGPTFIYALNNEGNGVWQADATNSNTSALPTGLQNGLTAVAVDECDNVVYAGRRVGTRSTLLAWIGNKANWSCDNSNRMDLGLSFKVTGSSNNIPVFTNTLSDTTIVVDELFSFTYTATDADGEPLTYSIAGQPSFATFNHSTGELRGEPLRGSEGEYPFTVSVTDGFDLDHTSSVITVVRSLVPIAPYFTQGPDVVFAEPGELLALTFEAEDPQGEQVTLCYVEIDCTPFGSYLEISAAVEIGVSPITIVATDASGEATEKQVLIVVQGKLFDHITWEEWILRFVAAYAPDQTLAYDVARDTMFAVIDLDDDGFVRGIYTDFAVELLAGDPGTIMVNGGINSEHVWPQSKGAGEQPQRSDLYSLFPAKENVISSRGDHPFAEIPDNGTESWYRLDEMITTIPSTNIDEYSEKRGSEFEPRESVKGDIARAMLYFFTIYNAVADPEFFYDQLETLLTWNSRDSISADEIVRAYRIKQYQGNINPFLLDPGLAGRLYGLVLDVENTGEVPFATRLDQNYPNPFNPQTSIRYSLARSGSVELTVYNVLGERVATVVDGIRPVGNHTETFDSSSLASGIYLYRLSVGDYSETRRMVVLR